MDLVAAVRAEQIRALYRQSTSVLWTNVAISALVAAALWWAAPRPALICWVALMTVITLARGELVHRGQALAPNVGGLEPWGRRFVIGSTVAGAAWGLGVVSFFDAANGV